MSNFDKKKVLILTNGCPRRLLDSERLKRYFELNKYKVVDNPKEADIIFCNTCGANDQCADTSLTSVEKLNKYNKKLIVMGCISKTHSDRLKKIFDGEIITNMELNKIDDLFPENKIKFKDVPDGNKPYFLVPPGKTYVERKIRKVIGNYVEKNKEVKNVDEYSSFFIRICDGCMWNCTYCAIKRAVGDLRSKPIDICVKELKKGLSEGYTEFIIEADDSGAYGVDIGLTIVDLLKLMVKQKGDYKINLRSINPFWVVKYIDDLVLICKSGKIKGFQIPVQSGSPKVLKTMKRYTDTKKLAKALRQIRETGVKLTTDIIVGFPGETKKDVELTFDFIKEANLDSIFLVPYARMKGTESYDMKQVPKEESLKRIEYLKKELGDSKIEVLKEYKWSLFHYLSRI